MRIGSLELDPMSRQVWVRGEPVALSKKEYALLRALAGEPTRVFTREELLRGVWGFRAMGHDAHARLARVPAAPEAEPGRATGSWSTCGASATAWSTGGIDR